MMPNNPHKLLASFLWLVVPAALLASCAPAATAPTATSSPTPAPTVTPQPTQAPIILQYLGNSCTLVIAPDGTRIVSDPYGKYQHSAGLSALPTDLTADAVTVSHRHPDHNNTKAVQGSPQLITKPGTYQVGMVKVTGYEGREGSPTGPGDIVENIIAIQIGDVKIVHLGDSGPITDANVVAGIEEADVVIVNIDGYVIPPKQLIPFLQHIKARTIIPSHYSHSESARWVGAPTIEEFLAKLPPEVKVVKLGSEIQVTPNMPSQVAVLTPLMLIKK